MLPPADGGVGQPQLQRAGGLVTVGDLGLAEVHDVVCAAADDPHPFALGMLGLDSVGDLEGEDRPELEVAHLLDRGPLRRELAAGDVLGAPPVAEEERGGDEQDEADHGEQADGELGEGA